MSSNAAVRDHFSQSGSRQSTRLTAKIPSLHRAIGVHWSSTASGNRHYHLTGSDPNKSPVYVEPLMETELEEVVVNMLKV